MKKRVYQCFFFLLIIFQVRCLNECDNCQPYCTKCFLEQQRGDKTITTWKRKNLREYNPNDTQDVLEILRLREQQRVQCQSNKCDYPALLKYLYHTIPKEILDVYINAKELKLPSGIQKKIDGHSFGIKQDIESSLNNTKEKSNDPLGAKQATRIRAEPEMLNFGIRPFGTSILRQMKIVNMDTRESVAITNVSYDSTRISLDPLPKFPIKIAARKHAIIEITLTALDYGNATTYVLFKLLNNRSYVYKVTAYSIENSYELKPLYLPVHSNYGSQHVPVYIRNPYSYQILSIACVNSDSDLKITLSNNKQIPSLCSSDNSLMQIDPLQLEHILSVKFTGVPQGRIFSRIYIQMSPEINITLPVIIEEIKVPFFITPRVVDFGIVYPNSGPHRIELGIEAPFASVIVEGVTYSPNQNFVLNLPLIGEKSIVISKGQARTDFGYIGFYASKPGNYSTFLRIRTNSSTVLEVEVRGVVSDLPLVYSFTDISVDTSRDKLGTVNSRQIQVTNNASNDLIFTQVISDSSEVKAKLLCDNIPHMGAVDKFKGCIKFIKGGEKAAIVKVKYKRMKSKSLPAVINLNLLSTNVLYSVPLLFFSQTLYCSYYEQTSISENFYRKECSKVNHINMRYFSEEVKHFTLNLTNFGANNIYISGISLNKTKTSLKVESIGLCDLQTGKIIKEISNLNGNEFQTLALNSSFFMTLHLSLSASKGRTRSARTPSSTMLNIKTSGMPLYIIFHYQFQTGEISLSPSRMRFEPGFSGTYQKKELKAISTFQVPVRVIRTWTRDNRIELTLIEKTISADSKIDLGIVSFDPSNTVEENEFRDKRKVVLSWTQNAVTLGEYKLWRKRSNMEDRASNTKGTIIDTMLYFETDIVPIVKLPVKAELAKPILVENEELHFPVVQNGTSKDLMFEIYNPSVEPLAVQLFVADYAVINYKSSALSVKNCEINYYPNLKEIVEHGNEYILKHEFPRGFSSYKEFLHVYCCYMASQNATELLKYGDADAEWRTACDHMLVMQSGNSVDEYSGRRNKQEVPTILSILFTTLLAIKDLIAPRTRIILPKPVNATNPSEYFSVASSLSNAPLIIAPQSRLMVGPIKYHPENIGEHTAAVFIKNNLTILYPVKLKAESGSGILEIVKVHNRYLGTNKLTKVLPKEYTSIIQKEKISNRMDFNFSKSDLLFIRKNPEANETMTSMWYLVMNLMGKLEPTENRVKTIHERIYYILNSGNLPLLVTSISIGNRGCSGYGFSIKNCKEFTVNPNETHKLVVQYEIRFGLYALEQPLIFETPYGLQTFDISLNLPILFLYGMHKLPSAENSYENYWRICVSFLMLLIAFPVAVLTIGELLYNSPVIETTNEQYDETRQKPRTSAVPKILQKELTEISAMRKKVFKNNGTARKGKKKHKTRDIEKNKKQQEDEPEAEVELEEEKEPEIKKENDKNNESFIIKEEEKEKEREKEKTIVLEIEALDLKLKSQEEEIKETSFKEASLKEIEAKDQHKDTEQSKIPSETTPDIETEIIERARSSSISRKEEDNNDAIEKNEDITEPQVENSAKVEENESNNNMTSKDNKEETVVKEEPKEVEVEAEVEVEVENEDKKVSEENTPVDKPETDEKKEQEGDKDKDKNLDENTKEENTKEEYNNEENTKEENTKEENTKEESNKEENNKEENNKEERNKVKDSKGEDKAIQSNELQESTSKLQTKSEIVKDTPKQPDISVFEKSENSSVNDNKDQLTNSPSHNDNNNNNNKAGYRGYQQHHFNYKYTKKPYSYRNAKTYMKKPNTSAKQTENNPIKEQIGEIKDPETTLTSERSGELEEIKDAKVTITETSMQSPSKSENGDKLMDKSNPGDISKSSKPKEEKKEPVFSFGQIKNTPYKYPQCGYLARDEDSEKGASKAEIEYYKSYNPPSNANLKLPVPFTVKEEQEKIEEKDQDDIDLFEAFKSANSLFGNQAYFTQGMSSSKKTVHVSTLSELSEDSVEYIPEHKGRVRATPEPKRDSEGTAYSRTSLGKYKN